MKTIVSVRFKPTGKSYYFDPDGLAISAGDYVIVDTARGQDCGEVSQGPHSVPDSSISSALKKVVRIADDADVRRMRQNREDEKAAFTICEQKIEARNLPMKLIDVEYSFNRNKILFYFTADGRIDFRELVKDLAAVFRTRIELRQIGVRDESKMLGGLGICGQPFCCSRFLKNFQPVSIKMAKEQGLSLNPAKISGSCGRLMCCLSYEQPAYEYLGKITPGLDSVVKTPDGTGTVTEVNLVSGQLRVRLDASTDYVPRYYHRRDCEYIRGGKKVPVREETEPPGAPEDELSSAQDAPDTFADSAPDGGAPVFG